MEARRRAHTASERLPRLARVARHAQGPRSRPFRKSASVRRYAGGDLPGVGEPRVEDPVTLSHTTLTAAVSPLCTFLSRKLVG